MSDTDESSDEARQVLNLIESRSQEREIQFQVRKYFIKWYHIASRYSITKVEWILPTTATEEEKKRHHDLLAEWIEKRWADEPDRQIFHGFFQDRHRVQFVVNRRREEGVMADGDALEIVSLDPENPERTEYNTDDEEDRKIIEAWLTQQAEGRLLSDTDLDTWRRETYEEVFEIHPVRWIEQQN
ncbi:uncharacterized protein BO80DRAFT_441730 [Aspergillus ibericus CBS 121593]|uniref:Uncharacterized protein n=1 Tax=Aspergillus ibericus CBS 121593 TaxID=1448316 RepID=A0A395H9A9_9EURO|nr:hypothetical protein BO80DRAFT_441730 [Aspergillus ibericus CBS 121593]RAL04260.1 hypothetical protein BO80DRAFT_441730 [Aspergillus ibericus CBS 121593]